MAEGYAAAAQRGPALDVQKLGGSAGLGFVAGIILQNAVLSRGGPLPDAGLQEVVDHYAEAGIGARLTVALVAVNMLLLFLFAAAARSRLSAVTGAEVPSRIGLMGVVLLSATFGATALFQSVLIAGGSNLASSPDTTKLLWDLHTGSLILSQLSLGLALLGFASAAFVARTLTPRWLAQIGMVGGALLIVSGSLPFSAIEGSKTFFLGFPGFFIWIAWLATAGATMFKTKG